MEMLDRISSLVKKIEKNEKLGNYIFVSLASPTVKAKVKRLKVSRYLNDKIFDLCLGFKDKTGNFPEWIKIDIITDTKQVEFESLKKEMEMTRRNYIDYGVSYDKDYILSFLPEEINANAFLKPSKDKTGLFFSETNVNNYLDKYKYPKKAKLKSKYKPYRNQTYKTKQVIKFYTKSYFIEEDEIIELHDRGYNKGLRRIENHHEEIDRLIHTSVSYLKEQIKEGGQYVYGYFPHFDKKINFYNNLRHSSSTYALIEGLAYLKQDVSVAKPPLDYIIDHYLYEYEGAAFVYDDSNNIKEIKLGQNAAFVFAICEYLKYYPDELDLLKAGQAAAKGILHMVDSENASTTHVLNYPSLTVKDKFRVVYYDGEAALALLRLYQIDKNPIWLDTVKLLFEKFIEEKYWKYHDHWLGYCTNELVQIENDKRYFEFGIKNVAGYLDYIKNRETTFPTFLEMLMATYHLLQKAKQYGYEDLIEEHMNEDEFLNVIHNRADYQRLGYFYPEVAMYFKNPQRILGSFFIKHHGYRVRIDDIEHYISGYVQYQSAFSLNRDERKLNHHHLSGRIIEYKP
ncbi:poly(glycerol-phosphate) alpha-glucosyltransferase [Salipaludibacillus aurantiacus]|uniref:Poly(Glycerol-phosphate) alpha-glucosyltransferase n=1 Tax=Salipaludibacillus aurantiacus TaxID=1601833 RepID=A0A1H9UFM7_9BACI|nr:poly(glycerol-phosphate) alpha-glucosyltransferase [Salipaludibacillus aurantiacus]SES08245.1 hypothetical protein SAMN05518684_107186 [Salipaludibacillus aurantiacus]